jgi:PucR C-terminal helix-turn-helix domain
VTDSPAFAPDLARVEGRGRARTDRFAPLSDAIAAGRSLHEVARAAAGALDASLLVTDDNGATLAVVARSPADERALLSRASASPAHELRRGDRTVGRLLLRAGESPPPSALRVVGTLIAAEVERHGANDRSARAEESRQARALLAGGSPRAAGELSRGGAVLVVRVAATARIPSAWEERLLLIVRRAAAVAVHGPLATTLEPSTDAFGGDSRIAVVLPAPGDVSVRGAAERIAGSLAGAERGHRLALGYSRHTGGRPDFLRAGREAELAAALAGPSALLAFADTGAYRLLLPVGRSGSSELRRFYGDTVGPLVDHDASRGTDLVETLEAFLASDASPSRAAERLLTHRHTVRHRLRRIRELTGLDVGTTRGRERLSLGLKAMRVLAVWAPVAA